MEFFNIDSRLLETAKKAEEMASEQFAKISETAERTAKTILRMQKKNERSQLV